MSDLTLANESFGTRLRRIRESQNLSQAKLGRRASMHSTAITHFEANRRKPSFDSLRALAQALNVTADYLIGSGDQSTLALDIETKPSTNDR